MSCSGLAIVACGRCKYSGGAVGFGVRGGDIDGGILFLIHFYISVST